MATVQTALINRAMRMLSLIKSGSSPTANESNDVLVALNSMLDSWRTDELTVYSVDEITGNIMASKQSYTLGPSGTDIVAVRPISVENARLLYNEVNYPVEIIDQDQWAAIRVTTLTSNLPRYVYITGDWPNTTLKFWATPTVPMQVILGVMHPIMGMALADTLSVPPGYERAIASNLAVEIAPEFGASVSPELARIASSSLGWLKKANRKPIRVRTLGLNDARPYNIYADN